MAYENNKHVGISLDLFGDSAMPFLVIGKTFSDLVAFVFRISKLDVV